jgi:hypothetical protein
LTHQGQKAGQSFVRGVQVPAFKDSGKAREDDQFNYRIVTYTYTSLNFIYDAFYKIIDGKPNQWRISI